jgi:hypothetical protein
MIYLIWLRYSLVRNHYYIVFKTFSVALFITLSTTSSVALCTTLNFARMTFNSGSFSALYGFRGGERAAALEITLCHASLIIISYYEARIHSSK